MLQIKSLLEPSLNKKLDNIGTVSSEQTIISCVEQIGEPGIQQEDEPIFAKLGDGKEQEKIYLELKNVTEIRGVDTNENNALASCYYYLETNNLQQVDETLTVIKTIDLAEEINQEECVQNEENLEERDTIQEEVAQENLDESKLQKRTRKRQCNEDTWKRNQIKTKRNKGESYINWKNKVVLEKTMKNGCESCRLKCQNKFSKDQRLAIFKTYWNLGDINRQRDFILRHITVKDPKQRRVRESKGCENMSNRKHTVFYFLTFEGQLEKVCQKFFLDTLSISNQVVKTVIAKRDPLKSTVNADKRGKNACTRKIPRSVEKSVIDHIKSFQTIESHYCRVSTKKEYLPSNLNIKIMYKLYLEICTKKNFLTPVRESMYRHLFCTRFNLAFFKPKKDLCQLCEKFKHANEALQKSMEKEMEIHQKNKTEARNKKEADKEKAKQDKSICAAVYDLQKVLQCPKTENSLAYYKSKLAAYNLSVYDLATKTGHCFMWNETTGQRGSSEVGTCVLAFIEHKVGEGVKEFSFFSDNCCGQNRNKFIIGMYLYCVKKWNITISHTYLEMGHTQNEGDCIHSTIETAASKIPIYTPAQWYTVARTACKKNPYKVREINAFYDMKKLTTTITNNMDKIKWNAIKEIMIDANSPEIVKVKYGHSEDFQYIPIQKNKRSKSNKLLEKTEHILENLYKETLPISTKKFKGLKFLCEKLAIPEEYHSYFLSLKHTNNKKDKEADSSEDENY